MVEILPESDSFCSVMTFLNLNPHDFALNDKQSLDFSQLPFPNQAIMRKH
jgi:hypothetical protein